VEKPWPIGARPEGQAWTAGTSKMKHGVRATPLLRAAAGAASNARWQLVTMLRGAGLGSLRLPPASSKPEPSASAHEVESTRPSRSDIDREQYLAQLAQWSWGHYLILGGQ
jgi:hypothetical protein